VLVISFPPGNTADLVARVLVDPMHRALGQPTMVDNRPGVGGNIALQNVARAEKDGHTLLLTSASTMVINPAVYKNPGFDPERDFQPVAIVGLVPMVLLRNKEQRAEGKPFP
jgi:tripartite-type tricarboxylate transporter receptor subunit TctC